MISIDDLLQAALRLRPDRILLGELRGAEAVSFLRAVNTGHSGSFSTIHANSPEGALEQLVLMVMQAVLGLSRTDAITYARSVIDVIVQLGRQGSDRGIVAIEQHSAVGPPLASGCARSSARRLEPGADVPSWHVRERPIVQSL